MLDSIKRLVRQSTFGSLAKKVRRTLYPRQVGILDSQNAKYDQETLEVMRRVLRPDSCCIDIGAHLGGILQHMVRLSPRGTHFAFEPLPQLAALLRSTFPNVRIFEAAVSDYAGTATFVHVENDPCYSGLRQRIYDRPDPILKTITVKVVRLDEAIPENQPIAFVKLDIEGGEFHALRGASQMVCRCRPVIVFEAGHKSTGQYGVTPDELSRLVTQQYGYHLSTMHRWLARTAPYNEAGFCQNWQSGPDFYFIAYPAEIES